MGRRTKTELSTGAVGRYSNDLAPKGSALRRFVLYAALLALCYSKSLYDLARFAYRDGLFSYVLLVPAISGYLIWLRRPRLAPVPGAARGPGVFLGIAGLILQATLWIARLVGWECAPADRLSVHILSFCLLLWAGGFILLGAKTMRECLFPALFLVFMTPFPPALVNALEAALQYPSADVAYVFLKWTGIPVFRRDLIFQMPGITVMVAQECSGIRSSLILFITALLAGHLFLRTTWKRLLLAVIVIPLGIVRNAFRILVISLLCVRLDPSYIDSPIHRQGGPLFFVLSLIPFSLILFLLWRTERFASKKHSLPLRSGTDGNAGAQTPS